MKQRPNRGNAEAGRLVSARNRLSLALVAGLALAGCATRPNPFAMVEVEPGILEGYKPRTQADFDALRDRGVRTILSLEELPWDIWPERRHALRNGIQFRDVPILASPLAPSEKRVKQALLVLNDPSLRPIYVHCLLGEDRTTFLIGLYRVYFLGWTPHAAWAEMLRAHFHVRLTLRGFETYYWRHIQKPEWATAPRPPPEPKSRKPVSAAAEMLPWLACVRFRGPGCDQKWVRLIP